jgi:TPR repeat protein
MYYTGKGAGQNDALAFEYFLNATVAPLAYQPHSLELTTKFLAESYNNLGIMYQAGIGTRKNLKRAHDMYSQAVKFGSRSARQNLEKLYSSNGNANRNSLHYPLYR